MSASEDCIYFACFDGFEKWEILHETEVPMENLSRFSKKYKMDIGFKLEKY